MAKSTIQKNNKDALYATGLKLSLVVSISFSVISDSLSLIEIYSEVFFDSARMLISSSSSRIYAMFSFLVSPCRILSSISLSSFAALALSSTI